MKKIFLCILLIISAWISQAQPKREFRGSWVATVENIDWPSTKGTSSTAIAAQKIELENIFIQHKKAGINAIFFQVRTRCDALYKSPYEPWSSYLTGAQGAPPEDPNYDPLQYAVDLAKKYGMELHAWINPYRVLLTSGDMGSLATNNVAIQHPEWIVKCATSQYRFLNPGIPAVREYVTKIIMDIVKRYDIDGMHFDDYFYPYLDYGTFDDNSTFSAYSNGITDIKTWRRNNVNLLLKMVNDSIQTVKPYIKWGISPSGNPSVNGDIYCDPDAWLGGKLYKAGKIEISQPYIDYILPQLYWKDFKISGTSMLPYWDGTASVPLYGSSWAALPLGNRDLYTGLYTSSIPANIGNQIRIGRADAKVKGNVHFSAAAIMANSSGITDTLIKLQPKIALIPQQSWKDLTPTNPVSNVRLEYSQSKKSNVIKWDLPLGETAKRFVIYAFSSTTPIQQDIDNAQNIIGLVGESEFLLPTTSIGKKPYIAVTALDRNNNESNISNIYKLESPTLPILAFPNSNAVNQKDTIVFKWYKAQYATSYQIQLSSDSKFSNIVKNYNDITDTSLIITNLTGLQSYYWRVKASNLVDSSSFSTSFSFTTGFPKSTVPVLPTHGTLNLSPNAITLKWNSSSSALKYNIRLGKSSPISASTLVLDTVIVKDTVLTLIPLLQNQIYFWNVKAINNFGSSAWSNYFGFKTGTVSNEKTEIKNYSLMQNYPNPFNPTTIISFMLKNSGHTTLKVYNVMGEEIATLVNNYLVQGKYDLQFNANQLPSGIYIYKLTSGNFSQTKKMMLIK